MDADPLSIPNGPHPVLGIRGFARFKLLRLTLLYCDTPLSSLLLHRLIDRCGDSTGGLPEIGTHQSTVD